jgi:hypothetical protein
MSAEVLWAEAVLGKDAQEFLESDIGRYLIGRCDQEIAEAQERLNTVSAWRRRRIVQLQNEIWRAQSVKVWLVELVQAGAQAEAILDDVAEPE